MKVSDFSAIIVSLLKAMILIYESSNIHLYLNSNSLGVIGSPTVISIDSGTCKCSLNPIKLTFNPHIYQSILFLLYFLF